MTKRLTTKEKNKKLAKEGKMLNHFGIVLRLYPSKEQTVLINKTIGSARLIYNMYFSERQDFYKSTGKTLTVAKYKEKYLVPMKKTEEYNFLREVDKFALEASLEHLDDAYDRFFKKQSRFPKFKSKHKAKKAYTTKFINNNIELKKGFIKLPKLGLVKFNLPNKIGGNLNKAINKEALVKKATVSEKAGKYYVSVLCEEIVELVKPLDIENIDSNKVIGIDLGLIDFAHQLSRRLVNENQVIIVEDLNIKGMVKNKNLSKVISDTGWSRFVDYLEYKLKKEGKYLVKIDRWFASSKQCSNCNEKNIMLTLNQREWVCSSCGAHLDRDINASVNIRKEGMRVLGLTA